MARLRLLDEEKKETRRRDALKAERRRQRRAAGRDARPQLFPARWQRDLPHLLDLWAGQRVHASLYTLLDLTALDRQEAWEEPTDRVPVLRET